MRRSKLVAVVGVNAVAVSLLGSRVTATAARANVTAPTTFVTSERPD